MPAPDPATLGYIAGFFDADGSVRLRRRHRKTWDYIEADARLVGPHLEVYRRIQVHLGGIIYAHGEMWEICWQRQTDLLAMLEAITPLLIERRQAAEIVLAYLRRRRPFAHNDEEDWALLHSYEALS